MGHDEGGGMSQGEFVLEEEQPVSGPGCSSASAAPSAERDEDGGAPSPQPSSRSLTLRFACGHTETVDTRPNPRLAWPAPRTCPVCKRSRRVGEIAYPTNRG